MEIIFGIIIIFIIYQAVKASSLSKSSQVKRDRVVQIEVSSSGAYERPNGKPAKWYGAGQSVNVQGYDITGGMIYVGEKLLDTGGYDNDACLINPNLNVSPAETRDGDVEMGYWPQYAQISPKCRKVYLKWLAGGRSNPEVNIGYVFLFFYGLERRLFVDGQKESVAADEKAEIVEEVNRLLKIYGGNRSFRGYATNLLAMEWVLYQSHKPVPDYLDFNDRYCSEPFQV